MKFDLVTIEGIEAEWPRFAPLLAPAVAVDEAMTLPDVQWALLQGEMALYDIDLRGVKGVVVVEINQFEVNEKQFWLRYISGRISGPPSEWLGRVKTLLSYFVGIARAMNCTEIRLCGRDWSKILPEWEQVGPRHELRLVL